jgi:phospholipid:diacylglycerol acyltransferase
MDALRRRLGQVAEKPPEKEGREAMPDDERAPSRHQSRLRSRPTWGIGSKRRHAWVFVLGGIFGLLLAAFLANNNDLIDLAGLNLEGFVDVLPAGFMSDIYEFQVRTSVSH